MEAHVVPSAGHAAAAIELSDSDVHCGTAAAVVKTPDGLGAVVRLRADLDALDLWMEFDLLNKIQDGCDEAILVSLVPGRRRSSGH